MELAYKLNDQISAPSAETSNDLAILWNVINIYQYSSNLSNRLLGKYDLPLTQFILLSLFMANVEEGRTVTNISHVLPQNQPTISKIVQKLLKKGYLASYPTTHDARSKILKITPAGQDIYHEAIMILEKNFGPIFNQWPSEELDDLIEKLKVMRSYLEAKA